jgi:putative ABC transport system permease protein
MLLRDTIQTAYKGVTRNVSRAMLTMLGIVIGVGAVVLMSAIGASMRGVILSQISSLGPTSMVIFPGQQEGGPNAVSTGHDSITFEDVEALKRLSTVKNIAPIIFLPGNAKYRNEEKSPQTLGVIPTYFENQNYAVSAGRLIDENDLDGARAVAVVGRDTALQLFGSTDPLGKRIQLGENHFTVIGVMKPIGSQFFQNADERIFIPYTVAKNLTGQKYVNFITMQSTGNFDLALDEVTYLLRDRHGINNPKNDPKKDDFVVRTSAQANDILSGVSLGLSMFIITIAAISLLVGGIGIMNIMLVTVTERTQEIGLRKALGAKKRDILLQFLFESVFLTVLGGLVGMAIGLSLAMFASILVRNFLSTYHFAVSTGSMIAAFLMAFFTGLLFGISPARKAANLSPMEALRYE